MTSRQISYFREELPSPVQMLNVLNNSGCRRPQLALLSCPVAQLHETSCGGWTRKNSKYVLSKSLNFNIFPWIWHFLAQVKDCMPFLIQDEGGLKPTQLNTKLQYTPGRAEHWGCHRTRAAYWQIMCTFCCLWICCCKSNCMWLIVLCASGRMDGISLIMKSSRSHTLYVKSTLLFICIIFKCQLAYIITFMYVPTMHYRLGNY